MHIINSFIHTRNTVHTQHKLPQTSCTGCNMPSCHSNTHNMCKHINQHQCDTERFYGAQALTTKTGDPTLRWERYWQSGCRPAIDTCRRGDARGLRKHRAPFTVARMRSDNEYACGVFADYVKGTAVRKTRECSLHTHASDDRPNSTLGKLPLIPFARMLRNLHMGTRCIRHTDTPLPWARGGGGGRVLPQTHVKLGSPFTTLGKLPDIWLLFK
jgi:hypothetical protein